MLVAWRGVGQCLRHVFSSQPSVLFSATMSFVVTNRKSNDERETFQIWLANVRRTFCSELSCSGGCSGVVLEEILVSVVD